MPVQSTRPADCRHVSRSFEGITGVCASTGHSAGGQHDWAEDTGKMYFMPDDLETFDQDYEDAEAAFLAAVRRKSTWVELAAAARAAATAAEIYNHEAYREFHVSRGSKRENLDSLTERTEVLSELWVDIADAFEA
jgi:formylglycine-generating enzyme required for sulfatase activity